MWKSIVRSRWALASAIMVILGFSAMAQEQKERNIPDIKPHDGGSIVDAGTTVRGSYHAEMINVGSHKALHIAIMTDSDFGDVVFDRGVFDFGDGYRMAVRNKTTPGVSTITITGIGPDGETENRHLICESTQSLNLVRRL